jgi:hypothetical protein
MENKPVIWLASYPKSGNTWFRTFITALTKGNVDINNMSTDGIYSAKGYIEDTLDLEVDYLTEWEHEQFRKKAFVHMYSQGEKKRFVKIHDAFTFLTWDGEPLIPLEVSKVVIYLIRNPLDVALSFANHNGQPVQETIDKFICSSQGAMVKRSKATNQSRQLMGTWGMHAESWITQKHLPVCVLRYEDMKADPFASFAKAVETMGLSYSAEQIEKAIELTRFERLKAQEEEKGFKEKAIKSSSFFHQGKAGRWKEELTLAQIHQIMLFNEKMMRKFGYWGEAEAYLKMNSQNAGNLYNPKKISLILKHGK